MRKKIFLFSKNARIIAHHSVSFATSLFKTNFGAVQHLEQAFGKGMSAYVCVFVWAVTGGQTVTLRLADAVVLRLGIYREHLVLFLGVDSCTDSPEARVLAREIGLEWTS